MDNSIPYRGKCMERVMRMTGCISLVFGGALIDQFNGRELNGEAGFHD